MPVIKVTFHDVICRDYLSFMGVAHEDSSHPKRKGFLSKVSKVLKVLAEPDTDPKLVDCPKHVMCVLVGLPAVRQAGRASPGGRSL